MDTLLILADLDASEERVLAGMALASRLELVTCSKVETAMAWLDAHEPRVVAFKASARGMERLCNAVRSSPGLASVPLIGLVEDISDPFVEKLYALGADDVVMDSFGPGFFNRLKTLPDRMALPPQRGMALVGDADRERASVVSRVLGNAGYDVKAAHDPLALDYYVKHHRPRLVVTSADFGAPRKLITDARQGGVAAPWIVTAKRRDFLRYAELLSGLERVSVVAATTTPEIVLYAANELLRGEIPPARSEDRHLYGTAVLFRPPGGDTDELGFSYNISSRGLFVRTLSPVDQDTVWVELRPPRCRQRVRLEGRVAWRRRYVPTAASTGPPGFGVELTDGLTDSLSLWREQVRAFVSTAHAGALAVGKMHTTRLGDSRTSGEYMLIEVPSESLVPVARAMGDGTSVPPEGAELPGEIRAALGALPAHDRTPVLPPVAPARERADHADDWDDDHEDVRDSELDLESGGELLDDSDISEPEHEDVRDSELDLESGGELVRDSDISIALPRAAVVSDAPLSRDSRSELEPEARGSGAGSSGFSSRLVVGWVAAGLLVGTVIGFVYLPSSAQPVGARETSRATARERPTLARAPEGSNATGPGVDAAGPLRTGAGAPASSSDRAGLPPELDGSPSSPSASAHAKPEPTLSAAELSALAPDQGYLMVKSSRDADVYATGFKAGAANQPNKAKCGLRWVRLGAGDPPKWISPGRTVDVKCGALTTITLEPGPSPPEE